MDPNATLADLPGLTVQLVINPHVDRTGHSMNELGVYLDYGFDAFAAAHDGACAMIDAGAVSGEVDAAPLEVVIDGEYDPEWGECESPELLAHAVVPPEGAGHVIVRDATRTIEAELAPGSAVARKAVLVGGGAWAFTRGATLSIRWSHPEDLVDVGPDDIHGFFDDGRGHYASMTGAMTSPDTFELVIPVDAPVGAGELYLSIGRNGSGFTTGSALTCAGAESCTYTVFHNDAHAVQLD